MSRVTRGDAYDASLYCKEREKNERNILIRFSGWGNNRETRHKRHQPSPLRTHSRLALACPPRAEALQGVWPKAGADAERTPVCRVSLTSPKLNARTSK